MLGWLILFASMAAPGAFSALTGDPVTASVKSASLMFAVLFMVGLLTRVARGRAW
jgi:hypothetical protein